MQTGVVKQFLGLVSLTLTAFIGVAACSSEATKTSSTTTSITTDGASSVASSVATGGSTSDVTTTVPGAPATVETASTIASPEGGVGEPLPADVSPSAWIAGAQEGDPEVTAAPGSCEPFYEAIAGGPYAVQRCGLWNAIGGQRMWTVTKGTTGRFFAIIWQQIAPNNWVPMLRASEDAEGLWSDFMIRTGNIDSGPNDELVSGVRIAGTGGYLDLSVVDIRAGNPRVMAVYNGITKGTAVLRPSDGVEFWVGLYADADPGCCPSTFQRYTIFSAGASWLVVPGPTLPVGDPTIALSEF